MVAFEISLLDIILMIAITIFITIFVTLLIKLKPSTETTMDEYVKNQPEEQTTPTEMPSSNSYPLETFQKHRTPNDTSKPITIAEALRMNQTSTATVETAKEPEVPTTTKTPKIPTLFIESQRDREHKEEFLKALEKLEAPKTEEEQPPTPPPMQTPASPTKSVDADPAKGSPECAHHFGYLRTLPKNTPIPDECLGCTRIMECFIRS